MIVSYSIEQGTQLTPEQIKRIDALKGRPIVFDEDCPEMTEEQLKQFRRVHPLSKGANPRRHLSVEEIEAIEARAPRDEDITYDKECPEMTDEQLRRFKRVHT